MWSFTLVGFFLLSQKSWWCQETPTCESRSSKPTNLTGSDPPNPFPWGALLNPSFIKTLLQPFLGRTLMCLQGHQTFLGTQICNTRKVARWQAGCPRGFCCGSLDCWVSHYWRYSWFALLRRFRCHGKWWASKASQVNISGKVRTL